MSRVVLLGLTVLLAGCGSRPAPDAVDRAAAAGSRASATGHPLAAAAHQGASLSAAQAQADDQRAWRAFHNRGCALLDAGRNAAAADDLEAAVRLRPDAAESWLALAQARYANGDADGAKAALDPALAAGGELRAQALASLAALLLRQGNHAAATTALQDAAGLATTPRTRALIACNRAALAITMGDPATASSAAAAAVTTFRSLDERPGLAAALALNAQAERLVGHNAAADILERQAAGVRAGLAR